MSDQGELMTTVKQWIKIEGLDKEDILKNMGFTISSNGYLNIDGRGATSLDGTSGIKVSDVKGIVPGSLALITDVSEVELIEE
jgi:hypothetical protein